MKRNVGNLLSVKNQECFDIYIYKRVTISDYRNKKPLLSVTILIMRLRVVV